MKTKSIIVLATLFSVNSMAYCLGDNNKKTDTDINFFNDDDWDYDQWIEELGNSEEDQKEAQKELKTWQCMTDEILEQFWEEMRDSLVEGLSGLEPAIFEEVEKMIEIMDEHITNIPRLLLLLVIQMETFINETIMASPYGPPAEETRVIKNFLQGMRMKLLYHEITTNNKLTNVDRLKIFNKAMKSL